MSTPTERILPYLEQIRDERHTAANTAVRVGNALIMLLDYISSADPSGKFLLRVDDDTAEGVITFMRGLIAKLIAHFEKGADFGTFLTGISGGKIDQYGNGELESLVLRSFLEAPEQRINSVSINVGDDWHTNGRGLIEWVEPDTDGQGNLLTTGTFGLHLEEGVPGAVKVGDRCKGIVNNMLDASMAEDADKDDGRGNRAFRGFYTTYFQITQVSSADGGINNVCRYSLRPTITENGTTFWRRDDGTSSGVKGGALFHPAKSMTFAQYSHPTDASRQNSRYNAVGTNTYTRYLRNMTGWDESLANIAVQIGNTPLIAQAFPDDPRAQQAGQYSVWLDGDIFFSGNLVQVDPWGRDIVIHPDQGNFVQTGVDYYYNDLVHYNNKLYYCVYAEKDANGLYKPLRLAHVDAQHPNGINCIPGEDEHWMVYLEVENVSAGGNWRSDRVPYPTNAMVTLGTAIYISNKETSNPPVGLLKDKNGKYIVTKDGGYIIANDTVTDDWELLFSIPDITRGTDGADAINVNLTNDTDTVFTDEHGNIPAGAALPTTQGQLFEGADFVQSGVTWTIDQNHSSGCTATINASTGVVTVTSMTADAAVIRVTATYKGKPYYRDFTFKKTFGKDKLWIVPSSNAIVYNPNDGTFSPSRITLGAYILRGAHGTQEEVTGDSIGYMLYSKLNPTTGVVETVRCYHNAQVPIDANSFINGELAVVLYDRDGVRQDAESIPKVTSGLNAKSLEARYSQNMNGPWHSTFQTGDKWMQTREEGGQWGQSVKIVGEDGDKYQFDFNASMDKVSQNATTPPQHCALAQWQDAPLVVPYAVGNNIYPYLWMKQSEVNPDGTLANSVYIRLTGEDGKSILNRGPWKSNEVPYAEQEVVTLGGSSFIALRDTSNPPLGLLKDKDGKYITTKDGGYIIAKDELSDDWQYMAEAGTGVRIVSKSIEYAIGTDGQNPPTTGWSATQPSLQQGQWLWVRRVVQYSDGTMTQDYSVSYAGIDPDGFEDIITDFAKSQDELVMPRDEDLVTWVPNFSDLDADQGDFVWTRYTIKYDNDDRPPVKSFMCTRIGMDGGSVIAVEEFYIATASNSQAPAKTAQGWSENFPAQTPPNIYVWNFERTSYSDGRPPVDTDVHCLNPNGKGIANIVNRYAISAYGVGQQGTGYPSDINPQDWTDEVYDRAPTKDKPYQWNWERINYTDNTHEDTYHVSAVRGSDGEGFDWKGYFVPGTLYKKNEVVRLVDGLFIALRDTTNPPLGLLMTKDGDYITTKDGGYIVANDLLSDDWERYAMDGQSVKIVEKRTEYAIGTNGKDRPTTGWSTTQPELQQGQWLWTRRVVQYSDGTMTEDYSVSYAGIDPDGLEDIVTDFAKSQDELEMPRDEDLVTWVPNFSDLDAGQGDFVWTRYTVKYDNDDRPPVKSFMCTRIGMDGGSVIAVEEFYIATASNSQAPAKTAQGWSESYPAQTPPNIYIWNFERTTYSDGRPPVDTDVHCLNPNGKGIANIVNRYAISAYGVGQQATGYPSDINPQDWTDEVYDRAPTADKPYQWNWERINYTDNTHEDTYHVSAVRGSDGEGFEWKGNYVSGTQYKMNEVVRLAGGSYIALRDTTNPPLGLLTDKNGRYITTKDGGYIVANNTMSDDWDVFVESGKTVYGDNAIYVDFSEDAIVCRTDAEGSVLPGQSLKTTARLYDGGLVPNGVISWTLICENCTAYIDALSGLITISSVTEGTTVKSASITAVALYRGVPYTKTLSITKSFGAEVWQVTFAPDELIYNPNTEQWSEQRVTFHAKRWVDGEEKSVSSGIGFIVVGGRTADGRLLHDGDSLTIAQLVENYGLRAKNMTLRVELYSGEDYTGGNWRWQDGEDLAVVVSGADGDSAWTADSNNEMDSVSCDDTGNVVSEQVVATTVKMFHGKDPTEFFFTDIKRNGSAPDNTVTVTPQTSLQSYWITLQLRITYKTTAKISGKDEWTITVKSVRDTSIERTLKFTVNGVIGDVYNLKTSVDDIHATRSGQDYVVGGSQYYDLRCGFTKNDRGAITPTDDVPAVSSWDSQYHVDSRYNIYFRRRVRATGDWEVGSDNKHYWWCYSLTGHKSKVAILAAGNNQGLKVNTYDAVEFVLSTDKTVNICEPAVPQNIIDRETVFVLADGLKGDPGQNGQNGAPGQNGQNGTNGKNADYEERQYRNYDSKGTDSSGVPSGSGQGSWQGTIPAYSVSYPFLWFRVRKHTFDEQNAESIGSWSYGLMTEPGAQGDRGEVGLWYEYAGVWGVDCGPSTSLPIQNADMHGWYVKYGSNFYMNIMEKDAQGNYPVNTNTPSGASGSGWEQMDGIRQYFMAKAIFADYAQFGRFLINGDWMISSTGKVGGSNVDKYSEQYTKFDPQLMPQGQGTIGIVTANVTTSYSTKSAAFNLVRGVAYTIVINISSVSATNPTITARLLDASGTRIGNEATRTGTGTITISVTANNSAERKGCYLQLKASAGTAIISAFSISSTTCFIPNLAFDGKSGRTYQKQGYFEGTVHATDGNFSGIIKARLFYAPTTRIEGHTYTVDPSKDISNTFIVYPEAVSSQPNTIITLPDPTVYDGLELKIFSARSTRNSGGTYLISSAGINYPDSNGYLIRSTGQVSITPNRFVAVIAAEGEWFIENP